MTAGGDELSGLRLGPTAPRENGVGGWYLTGTLGATCIGRVADGGGITGVGDWFCSTWGAARAGSGFGGLRS
ncbi:hypothetical protein CPB85DRAFT_1336016 [Mucidula mucida]|nr:hypothetical protein CPB85DRAFT_1336016 [Mucidula mucida]